jgi:hypothetical protein
MMILMAIYLDDRLVDLKGDDLGSVVNAVKERLNPAGRLVVEVCLGGKSLGPDEFDQNWSKPVKDADLRLYSADLKELVSSALEQVRLGLDGARQLQGQAAELLQQGDLDQALKLLGQALENWQQAPQVILQSAELLGVPLKELVFEDKPLAHATSALVAQLKSIRQSITDRDTVGLADALAYEWPQTTEWWDHFLADWRGRLGAPGGGAATVT